MEKELLEQNKCKMAKLQKIIFSTQLGMMNNGVVAPDVWDAAETLFMHMMRLAIPTHDVREVNETVKLLKVYGIKLPPKAMMLQYDECWGGQKGEALEAFRHVGTFKQADRQMVEMDCSALAKEKRRDAKETMQVERAQSFIAKDRDSIKLQAKMNRLKKREEEEETNCHVEEFDKRMEMEEQQHQQADSNIAGPSKVTGQSLRAIKFKKIRQDGSNRAKSSTNKDQEEQGKDLEATNEDVSWSMDIDDASPEHETSAPSSSKTKSKAPSKSHQYTKGQWQLIQKLAKVFISAEAQLDEDESASGDEPEDNEDHCREWVLPSRRLGEDRGDEVLFYFSKGHDPHFVIGIGTQWQVLENEVWVALGQS
ncbi:hypothetical protein EDD17DRAFT_1512191 [Pisolithus thermaeus]|nr:hypothetical protein EV401DRAFT_1893703 [Pisolithus croceorrhizus]KAI6158455.1 hypothetical protein EDD17DRAFT_1512191 [Pisolithus thermaeus]